MHRTIRNHCRLFTQAALTLGAASLSACGGADPAQEVGAGVYAEADPTHAAAQPPAASPWQPLAHQPTFAASTCLQMLDGTVLCQEYLSPQWWRLTPDNTGSYVSGTWTKAAAMASTYGPLYYASAVLADGRLVVIGGEYNLGSQVWTNQGSIYNPATNTWATLAPPAGWTQIGDAQSVVLPSGDFLLADPFTKSIASLNPATLTWTVVGTGKDDNNDEEGWELLPDGTILTVDVTVAEHAEKFISATGKWVSAGSTVVELVDASSEEIGPAVLRPTGTVFATGATSNTAIYTPPSTPSAPGTWAAGPVFPSGLDIADGPASILPSGNVLVMTSPGIYQNGAKFFEFNGKTLTAVGATPGAAGDSSFVGRMLALPTGQVLLTDGTTDIEVYTPSGSPQAAWAPTISSVPTTVQIGATYKISGTQFNGLSQGAAYGDDAQSATNYPLVRITNKATSHVFYARTHGHSTMGLSTGSATVSTSFDVTSDIELGASELVVVANGIPSAGVAVTVEGADNASFVSQSVPTTIVAGQKAAVSVVLKNDGATTWTAAGSYRLGAQDPQDNTTWGFDRVDLLATDSIAPGQSKTFSFTVTAPAKAGTYDFEWRMVHDPQEWFGASSTVVPIQVTAKAADEAVQNGAAPSPAQGPADRLAMDQ